MLIDESFVAGVPKVFNVHGNFLRIKSTSGFSSNSVTVEFFKGQSPLPVDLDSSDAGDRAFVPGGFDCLRVTSAVTQGLKLQVARGEVGSDRITGEVSVINGALSRARAGVSFFYGVSVAAVAAQYSHLQLWNPTVDRLAVVTGATFYSGVASGVRLSRHAVALTTLVSAGESKYIGGPVSAMQIRSQANAAIFGTLIFQVVSDGAQTLPLPFREPIVVPPGGGILIVPSVVNAPVNGGFEYFEESI